MGVLSKSIDKKWSFLSGAALGVVAFIGIYGVNVLDPTYDDWLNCFAQDLTQHYMGWELYRESAWHFPIGLCDRSCYPELSSVIYTDSIPLLCLFFKLLSPILPETFQFFGMYGMFCFAMQGGCAKLLLRHFFKDEIRLNVAALPFIFNIPFMQRMFYHTALASHYLILSAFILFFNREKIAGLHRRLLCWCILGMVCISIHFTVYGIVSLMMLCFSVYDGLMEKRGIKRTVETVILYLALYLASTVTVFYVFGGLYGDISGDSYGLGVYSANLNAFVDSRGFSKIIHQFPGFITQIEGFAYIGIAVILIGIPALIGFFKDIRSKKYGKETVYLTISIAVLCVLSVILAVSPVISLNDDVLFVYHLPKVIYDLWSIFRASGRFIWISMYVVILFSVVYMQRLSKGSLWKKGSVFILFCLMIVQIFEYSDAFRMWYGWYGERRNISFSAEELYNADLTGIKHIQFMNSYEFNDWYLGSVRDTVAGYTELAIKNDMTISNFHFSRGNMDKVNEQIVSSFNELVSGNPRTDTLYVFEKNDNYEIIKQKFIMEKVYELDTGTEIVLMAR